VVLLALACAVFGALAVDLVRHGPVTAADASISAWFHAHGRPAATRALLAVTHWHGTLGVLLMAAVAGLWLAWRRQWQWLALLAVSVPGGLVLNSLVKHAFHRARPHFDTPLVTLASSSFPSGHTAGATVWWGFALVWFFAHEPRPARRAVATCVAVSLIVLTALSRVYLGAHYLSDVLAAAAEGTAWLALCFTVSHRAATGGVARG
jgi:undecaprenyl-diphosphatase